MAERGVDDPCCRSCGKTFPVMKRCVQCQQVYYCSRSCQVADWKCHKSLCVKPVLSQYKDTLAKDYTAVDDKCIFTAEYNSSSSTKPQTLSGASGSDSQWKTHIDFQTTFNKLEKSDRSTGGTLSYLHNNDYHTDVPGIDIGKPYCEINIKSNKEKVVMKIQHGWSGEDIVKVFACHLKIPFENMKIIHKGKVMTKDTIAECIKSKAVFQVIGAKAADDVGLDKGDIDIMMSQLHLDRNQAVLALQKQGNLVDAIIEAGSKTASEIN